MSASVLIVMHIYIDVLSACVVVVVCMFSAKIVVCCYNVVLHGRYGVGANVILHLVMSTWITATHSLYVFSYQLLQLTDI